MSTYDMSNEDEIHRTISGDLEKWYCKVCGSLGEVERGKVGPISLYDGFSKKSTEHDLFYCPNINGDWHKTARKLMVEIRNTPSKRIAELMMADLEDILNENGKLKGE